MRLRCDTLHTLHTCNNIGHQCVTHHMNHMSHSSFPHHPHHHWPFPHATPDPGMKMAWTHRQTLWVPTTCLLTANRCKHKCEQRPKIAKTTPDTTMTNTLARTTPVNVGSPPHLKSCPSLCCQWMWVYTKQVKAGTQSQSKDHSMIKSCHKTTHH